MCSVRRIVPELISFDDLRDKFLSRVEVPRGPLRKLSRNFKGSRLSAQLLLVGWMVLIQKITTKTLRIQFGITMLLSSVTFSRMQEKTAGKADKGETWFSRRHPMAARKRCKKNVFSSTFCPLLPGSFSANNHVVKNWPVVCCLQLVRDHHCNVSLGETNVSNSHNPDLWEA